MDDLLLEKIVLLGTGLRNLEVCNEIRRYPHRMCHQTVVDELNCHIAKNLEYSNFATLSVELESLFMHILDGLPYLELVQ